VRAMLLDGSDGEHPDAVCRELLGRQPKPVGHIVLRREAPHEYRSMFAGSPRFRNWQRPIMVRANHRRSLAMTLALARRALFALTLLAAPAQAQQLDKVSFG